MSVIMNVKSSKKRYRCKILDFDIIKFLLNKFDFRKRYNMSSPFVDTISFVCKDMVSMKIMVKFFEKNYSVREKTQTCNCYVLRTKANEVVRFVLAERLNNIRGITAKLWIVQKGVPVEIIEQACLPGIKPISIFSRINLVEFDLLEEY